MTSRWSGPKSRPPSRSGRCGVDALSGSGDMEIRLTTPRAPRAWHDVPVLYFQFAVVAAVFAGIAWVAAGRGGGIVDAVPDRPDVALPDDHQLAKADIDAARFTVGWRGY